MNHIAPTAVAVELPIGAFRNAILQCGRALTRKQPGAVEVVSAPGICTVAAVDLDRRLQLELPAPDDAPSHRAAIPLAARRFVQTFGRATGAIRLCFHGDPQASSTVELEADDMRMTVTPEPDAETLIGNGFDMAAGPKISIDADLLLEAIEAIRFAISREETRYYLNGIFIERGEGDRLRLTATDGHRLASRAIDGVSADPIAAGFILPLKDVEILRDLLSRRDRSTRQAVLLTVDGIRCSVALAGHWTLRTKLIDGTYPDYRKVIPAALFPFARLDVCRARLVMRRILALHGRQVAGVKLAGKAGAGHVTASAYHPDFGTFVAPIPGECFVTGEVGFNARYVRDAAETIRAPFMDLKTSTAEPLAASASPAVFASAGEFEDPSTVIVVMPMRVGP